MAAAVALALAVVASSQAAVHGSDIIWVMADLPVAIRLPPHPVLQGDPGIVWQPEAVFPGYEYPLGPGANREHPTELDRFIAVVEQEPNPPSSSSSSSFSSQVTLTEAQLYQYGFRLETSATGSAADPNAAPIAPPPPDAPAPVPEAAVPDGASVAVVQDGRVAVGSGGHADRVPDSDGAGRPPQAAEAVGGGGPAASGRRLPPDQAVPGPDPGPPAATGFGAAEAPSSPAPAPSDSPGPVHADADRRPADDDAPAAERDDAASIGSDAPPCGPPDASARDVRDIDARRADGVDDAPQPYWRRPEPGADDDDSAADRAGTKPLSPSIDRLPGAPPRSPSGERFRDPGVPARAAGGTPTARPARWSPSPPNGGASAPGPGAAAPIPSLPGHARTLSSATAGPRSSPRHREWRPGHTHGHGSPHCPDPPPATTPGPFAYTTLPRPPAGTPSSSSLRHDPDAFGQRHEAPAGPPPQPACEDVPESRTYQTTFGPYLESLPPSARPVSSTTRALADLALAAVQEARAQSFRTAPRSASEMRGVTVVHFGQKVPVGPDDRLCRLADGTVPDMKVVSLPYFAVLADSREFSPRPLHVGHHRDPEPNGIGAAARPHSLAQSRISDGRGARAAGVGGSERLRPSSVGAALPRVYSASSFKHLHGYGSDQDLPSIADDAESRSEVYGPSESPMKKKKKYFSWITRLAAKKSKAQSGSTSRDQF